MATSENSSEGQAGSNVQRDHHAPVDGQKRKNLADWKPGSESDQAEAVGSDGDFGVHASRATQGERDYTNRNTKQSDPGAAQPWSREHDGNRRAGVQAHDSGAGSGSGGDVDPDVLGVGQSGDGLAMSGPGGDAGEAATNGSSAEFASGGPATGTVPANASAFSGSTYTGADRTTGGSSQGADAANVPGDTEVRGDGFTGEVSSDEAAGGDSVAR